MRPWRPRPALCSEALTTCRTAPPPRQRPRPLVRRVGPAVVEAGGAERPTRPHRGPIRNSASTAGRGAQPLALADGDRQAALRVLVQQQLAGPASANVERVVEGVSGPAAELDIAACPSFSPDPARCSWSTFSWTFPNRSMYGRAHQPLRPPGAAGSSRRSAPAGPRIAGLRQRRPAAEGGGDRREDVPSVERRRDRLEPKPRPARCRPPPRRPRPPSRQPEQPVVRSDQQPVVGQPQRHRPPLTPPRQDRRLPDARPPAGRQTPPPARSARRGHRGGRLHG